MRSTFSVLFYTKNQSLKDGRVPIMGRITINRTTACFSCKLEVSLALWDAKANRAKGKSDEARRLNQKLDHIKAQITRHYQYICDHDSLVTAKSVYNRYLGFGDSYHTLMGLFREELASYKEKVGKEKAASTYRGLVADYNNLLLFLKEKRRIEDIAIADLDKKFIEDYYNWMLGTCALASSDGFLPGQHPKMADVYRPRKRLDKASSVHRFRLPARIQAAFLPHRGGLTKSHPCQVEL